MAPPLIIKGRPWGDTSPAHSLQLVIIPAGDINKPPKPPVRITGIALPGPWTLPYSLHLEIFVSQMPTTGTQIMTVSWTEMSWERCSQPQAFWRTPTAMGSPHTENTMLSLPSSTLRAIRRMPLSGRRGAPSQGRPVSLFCIFQGQRKEAFGEVFLPRK